MTDDEAKAEAVRRWGSTAYAEHNENELLDVGNICTPPGWNPKKHGELKRSHGWGDTWEEAFALADERTWSYEYLQNPPERTTEADKETTQVRLFP